MPDKSALGIWRREQSTCLWGTQRVLKGEEVIFVLSPERLLVLELQGMSYA
jgi:hypothetical protein